MKTAESVEACLYGESVTTEMIETARRPPYNPNLKTVSVDYGTDFAGRPTGMAVRITFTFNDGLRGFRRARIDEPLWECTEFRQEVFRK